MKLPANLPPTSSSACTRQPQARGAEPQGLELRRRAGADVVGLDIQPGFVAAVQARVNGSIVAERAAMRAARRRRRCATAKCSTRSALARRAARAVRRAELEQARAHRRRQPAHRAAHARAAAGHRPEGARRRRHLPGPGPGADAAQQRRPRLPPARHHRHARRARASASCSSPPSATWSSGCSSAVRSAGLTAEGVDLSAFALIRSLYPPEAEQTGPRPLPERRRAHQPRDRRGHRLPLHPRRRQRARGHGQRARRAPRHRPRRRALRVSPRST